MGEVDVKIREEINTFNNSNNLGIITKMKVNFEICNSMHIGASK